MSTADPGRAHDGAPTVEQPQQYGPGLDVLANRGGGGAWSTFCYVVEVTRAASRCEPLGRPAPLNVLDPVREGR
jgi:hypothetical protein